MSFELIILGSSSALPTSKRSTAAHLLKISERFFLIDCGEGTQIQLRKNKISISRINHIFISHLHGDHVFGLFGLISSMGLMGRKADLHIYAPLLIEEMLQSHFNFFGEPPFSIVMHYSKNNKIVYQDSKVEVLALELKHRTETYGYFFKEKEAMLNVDKTKITQYGLGIEEIKNIKQGADYITKIGKVIPNSELTLAPFKRRSYAYISDTAFHPALVQHIKGVNLLFHEATFLNQDADLAKQTFHSTALQAAETAKMAEAEKLLIGHFSTRYKKVSSFVDEARKVFPDTVAVNDGDRFQLEQLRMHT